MSDDTSAAASQEALRALWQALLNALLKYLNDTAPEQRRASMLEVVRHFLSDNGMRVDSASTDDLQEAAQKLADLKLPFTH